jgi:cobalt/nickel transport system ATP-binding protein
LLQELDRIQAQGTTIVMATHNLDLAYAWADWVFVLHEGQLILSDRTNVVFSKVELLKQLQLEIPMLLEVWHALPMSWRNHQSPPKTIAELRSCWSNDGI